VSSDEAAVSVLPAFAAAQAANPGVILDPARFAARIGAELAEGAPLDGLHTNDLYLALACAAGDAAALARFEAQYAPEIERALARLRLRGPAAEEIHQRLRHKLFVAADGAGHDGAASGPKPRAGKAGAEPRIVSYSGRGPLRAWLRALVAHEALSEHRRRGREDHETDSVIGELAAGDDPELAEVRARYAAPFRDAFRDALASLPARDRNVLRLVYTEGLSVEQVAILYNVHRVSVSRWLGATRKSLLEETRARLRDRLRVDDAELASLTRLCLSQIDVSLDRLLST
jgi:RNA polymerase sigma-70 factor (ECF subfamily)